MKNKKTNGAGPDSAVLRIARMHFLYAALIAVQIVIYDAWKLLAPEAVLQRWLAVGLFFVAITAIWYVIRTAAIKNLNWMVGALILADIAIATFSIYSQRGMASRGVALYAIPLIVSALLTSRAALYATAALSVATYVTAAISYFVLNFNEGYKIELYGEVGFYAASFFIITGLLWVLLQKKK
jgi:hypothetical protein